MSKGFYKDLKNKKFGMLTASGYSHTKNGKPFWFVKCDCGKEKTVSGGFLVNGKSKVKSCGCNHRNRMKEVLGNGHKDLTGTFWCRLLWNAKARGHKVLITKKQALKIFESQNKKCALSGVEIVLDAPINKVTASLDRIDSNKDYSIDNVQWVHKTINIMKNKMSQDIFFEWIRKISFFKSLTKS